ncbi:MAG: radical SAM family heme chaperone HemW [Alphaproteobacteria bacterium]|jgi:oxygen-independent coproporphyrinogen-3 oxidase|nr:radical SAM family heme chaperone HemW [Alphaproteobacteria bacterium]
MTPALGLYIHWPFCVSKCPYCDFNSHVRNRIDEDAWQKALLDELHFVGSQTKGRALSTVFFGGGTPSLMNPRTVDALLSALSTYWHVNSDLEITLEANPGSVDLARFKDYRKAGVTRLSVGVQSLHDDALRFLGRKHNREEALKALEVTKQVFDRFSFDLIYARPAQTLKDWEKELQEALPLAGGHLSLYQLTIEPGTAFYQQHARGDWQLPPEDVAADMYELTRALLADHGLYDYEISNYAAPGQECQHNLLYWRTHDYLGIGPGAHGRLTQDGTRFETRCLKAPETWLSQVNTHGNGQQECAPLSAQDVFEETLLMGLRLKEGVCLDTLRTYDERATKTLLSSKALQTLVSENLLVPLTSEDKHLKATSAGRQRLNALLSYILS